MFSNIITFTVLIFVYLNFMLILWKNKKMFSQFSTEIQRKVLPVSVYWLYAKDKPVQSKFTCKMFIFLTQNFINYDNLFGIIV